MTNTQRRVALATLCSCCTRDAPLYMLALHAKWGWYPLRSRVVDDSATHLELAYIASILSRLVKVRNHAAHATTLMQMPCLTMSLAPVLLSTQTSATVALLSDPVAVELIVVLVAEAHAYFFGDVRVRGKHRNRVKIIQAHSALALWAAATHKKLPNALLDRELRVTFIIGFLNSGVDSIAVCGAALLSLFSDDDRILQMFVQAEGVVALLRRLQDHRASPRLCVSS